MAITNYPNGISAGGVPVLPGMNGVTAFRNVYFVDKTGGSDGNTGLGLDSNNSFKTVQKALDTVADEDTIIVMRGSYNEELTTGLYPGRPSAFPTAGAGRGRYVNLIGATNTPWAFDNPQLYNEAGSTATLRVRSAGWRISGFRFIGDSGSPILVTLELDQGASTEDTAWAPGTTIDNCVFYGALADCIGIDFQGAPHDCRVLNNIFELFSTAGKAAMMSSTSPTAAANRCSIIGNQFIDCVDAIDMDPRGFFATMILNNVINDGHVNTLVTGINLTAGNDNEVHGNYLSGDYTTDLGRYVAGSGDDWSGNYSMDTGAGSTSVDGSGLTVKIPQSG